MKFRINHILFLCLISSFHQYIQTSSLLRKSATTITPALRRTNPSLQQTAQYGTLVINANPDGSTEFIEFNENNQLIARVIQYPNEKENQTIYNPNGTVFKRTIIEQDKTKKSIYYYDRLNKFFYGEQERPHIEFIQYPDKSNSTISYKTNGAIRSETFQDKYGNTKTKPFSTTSFIDNFNSVYVFDKEGNHVGLTGTYDMNGLDKYGRTTDDKLQDLD